MIALTIAETIIAIAAIALICIGLMAAGALLICLRADRIMTLIEEDIARDLRDYGYEEAAKIIENDLSKEE